MLGEHWWDTANDLDDIDSVDCDVREARELGEALGAEADDARSDWDDRDWSDGE